MKPFPLSALPATLQAQALALLGGAVTSGPFSRDFAPKQNPDGEPKTIEEARKRLRQSSAPLNKTEQAFFDHLIATYGGARRVLSQSITLKLANGVRYTPDFIVQSQEAIGPTLCAYEVKGFMRDDAAVKLKVAAAAYPWIAFYLVTKAKRGGWDIQRIIS